MLLIVHGKFSFVNIKKKPLRRALTPVIYLCGLKRQWLLEYAMSNFGVSLHNTKLCNITFHKTTYNHLKQHTIQGLWIVYPPLWYQRYVFSISYKPGKIPGGNAEKMR